MFWLEFLAVGGRNKKVSAYCVEGIDNYAFVFVEPWFIWVVFKRKHGNVLCFPPDINGCRCRARRLSNYRGDSVRLKKLFQNDDRISRRAKKSMFAIFIISRSLLQRLLFRFHLSLFQRVYPFVRVLAAQTICRLYDLSRVG